jgi:hypothetical protein
MTPVRLEQVELVAVPHTESAEPDSVAGRHISRVSRLNSSSRDCSTVTP